MNDVQKEVKEQVVERVPTADEIFAVEDREWKKVPVPKWGKNWVIYIFEMSGGSRDSFERSIAKLTKENDGSFTQEMVWNNYRAKLVARCACNSKGHRIFNEDQVKKLGQKNWRTLKELADVAQELNGLTKEAIEETTKNSSTIQIKDSE